jgi:PST family polysaccharide transporter
MSLRQITISSAAMSSVSVLRMLTQLIVVPVLSHYLLPADYGVVAIAMPFVVFSMMFSDAGISASLICTSSKDADEWSTSFWLTVLLGAGLAVIISLLGCFFAFFLSEPILAPVVAALSLTVLLQSIATVPGASLQQAHKFTYIAGIEIISMFASLAAAYFIAVQGGGVWALVAQQIVQFSTKLSLTLFFAPFRPHFLFKIHKIKDHLIFGRNLLGSNFINFLRQSLSNLVTGKILGTGAVGILAMAGLFSDIPNRIISGPIQVVLYPHFSNLKHDMPAVRALFLFLSRIIAVLLVPTIGMLAVAHAPVFKLLLSEKWGQAGYVFMLLSPSACLMTITALRFTVAMALGKTSILIRQSIVGSTISIFFLLTSVYFGVEWVAIASTITTFVYTPWSLMQIFPLMSLPVKDYLKVIFQPIIYTLFSIIAYSLLIHSADLNDWVKFGMAVFFGMLALGASILFQIGSLRRELPSVQEIIQTSSALRQQKDPFRYVTSTP